jgi:hypothetical protein
VFLPAVLQGNCVSAGSDDEYCRFAAHKNFPFVACDSDTLCMPVKKGSEARSSEPF